MQRRVVIVLDERDVTFEVGPSADPFEILCRRNKNGSHTATIRPSSTPGD
jgi:hypothetical protein